MLVMVCTWKSSDMWELVVSYHVGQTQVIRLGSKYPPSHLASTGGCIFNKLSTAWRHGGPKQQQSGLAGSGWGVGKKNSSSRPAEEIYRVGRCGEGEALTYTVGLWLWWSSHSGREEPAEWGCPGHIEPLAFQGSLIGLALEEGRLKGCLTRSRRTRIQNSTLL